MLETVKFFRTLCLFTFFIVYSTTTFGQIYNPSEEKLYQSLIGDVHLLTLFVDTQDDQWEDEEKQFYFNELQSSQEWLVSEAEFYNQDLVFQNETFFVLNQRTIYLESLTRKQRPKFIVSKVMTELGYESFDDFLDKNNFDFKRNKLKLLFFVKSNDRSHAYNYFSNSEVDLAIVYCRSSYGQITDRYVISHELLHQFGAWDLYQGKSQTLENAKRLVELFPNSIMINTKRNKTELEVDDLTAWRIGWHNNLKDEYMDFHPRNSRNKPRSDRSSTGIRFDLKNKKKKEF